MNKSDFRIVARQKNIHLHIVQRTLSYTRIYMKLITAFSAIVLMVCCQQVNYAQSNTDSLHSSMGIPWGGTGHVCNVCHEPYNIKYSIKQTPYYNHQVGATTFRGNKMDGAAVMIKPANGSDKCLSCHKQMEEVEYKGLPNQQKSNTYIK